jgi:hypothetical protein
MKSLQLSGGIPTLNIYRNHSVPVALKDNGFDVVEFLKNNQCLKNVKNSLLICSN